MTDKLSYYERWRRWMLLEHGPAMDPLLLPLYESYEVDRHRFSNDRFYFGCGFDAEKRKYLDWDLCDLRVIQGAILWDVLLGFPYQDRTLREVKSKLSIGMLTTSQLRFVMRETARTLKVGGHCFITFRNFDRLLDHRSDIGNELFVRYVYGSSEYYGSRRKSCWTPESLSTVASMYNLELYAPTTHTGMNSNMVFFNTGGTLREFHPEPDVSFDDKGNMINMGGDFDMIGRSKTAST